MVWFGVLMKGVVSCDKFWWGVGSCWIGDVWMGFFVVFVVFLVGRGNVGNWNILVFVGKESKSDVVSRGDWKWYRVNWILGWKVWGMWCCRVCGGVLGVKLKFVGMWCWRGWKFCRCKFLSFCGVFEYCWLDIWWEVGRYWFLILNMFWDW